MEQEILDFIKMKMDYDNKHYQDHLKTRFNPGSEWSDHSWLVDEISQFLRGNIYSSYVLSKFRGKYDFEILHDVLKKNYVDAYDESRIMVFGYLNN